MTTFTAFCIEFNIIKRKLHGGLTHNREPRDVSYRCKQFTLSGRRRRKYAKWRKVKSLVLRTASWFWKIRKYIKITLFPNSCPFFEYLCMYSQALPQTISDVLITSVVYSLPSSSDSSPSCVFSLFLWLFRYPEIIFISSLIMHLINI